MAYSPKNAQASNEVFNYYLTMNVNNICRICLERGPKLMPIFDPVKPHHFSILIMACASVQVIEGDGLPSYICQKCISRLNIAYQFKSQCESSDTKMRQCFDNLRHMPPTPDLSGFIEIKKDNFDQNCDEDEERVICTSNQISHIDNVHIQNICANTGEKDLIESADIQILQSVQLEPNSSLQIHNILKKKY